MKTSFALTLALILTLSFGTSSFAQEVKDLKKDLKKAEVKKEEAVKEAKEADVKKEAAEKKLKDVKKEIKEEVK